MPAAFPYRSAIVYGITASILCALPLTERLSYEFALALSVVVACLSPWTGAALAVKRESVNQTKPSACLSALGIAVLTFLPALAIALLNTLRVKHCDLWGGLEFFLLMPCASLLYGTTLGYAAHQILAGFNQTRWRAPILVLFSVAPLLVCLYRLYTQPPIFVFDHLWGYFAGPIYDEYIPTGAPLWGLRLGTVLRIGAIFLGIRLVVGRRLTRGHTALLAGGILALLIAEHQLGASAGYRIDRAAIQTHLSQTYEEETFVLHLPADLSEEAVERLADEHRFWLSRHMQAVGLTSLRFRVHTYVYPSADEKHRWMGARHTMVAKPWLHEVHIHGVQTPHLVLAHELAHAVLATFAPGPLNVPARFGLIPNMGMVEGAAEALSPPRGSLNVHQAAQRLKTAQRAPAIRQLLHGVQLWSMPQRAAYAVSGSFLKYVLDAYGPNAFKQAYAESHLATIAGHHIDALIESWGAMLAQLPASDEELPTPFLRPAITQRPCPHAIAKRAQAARHADPDCATKLYRRIAADEGFTPSAQLRLAERLLALGQNDALEPLLQDLEPYQESLHPTEQAQLGRLRALLAWEQGDSTKARHALDHALKQPVIPMSLQRLLWVQRWAAHHTAEHATVIMNFLQARPNASKAAAAIIEAHQQAPNDATLAYLAGRWTAGQNDWQDAVEQLSRTGPHPFAPIEYERLRLLSESQYAKGDFSAAMRTHTQLIDLLPQGSLRDRTEIRRAFFAWKAAAGSDRIDPP